MHNPALPIYGKLFWERIMQIIESNKTQFEYDIQALLKSFYPEWEPRMLAPDSEVRDRRILEGEPVMALFFGEEEVTLEIFDADSCPDKIDSLQIGRAHV